MWRAGVESGCGERAWRAGVESGRGQACSTPVPSKVCSSLPISIWRSSSPAASCSHLASRAATTPHTRAYALTGRGLRRVGLRRAGLRRLGLRRAGLRRVGLRRVGLRRAGLRRGSLGQDVAVTHLRSRRPRCGPRRTSSPARPGRPPQPPSCCVDAPPRQAYRGRCHPLSCRRSVPQAPRKRARDARQLRLRLPQLLRQPRPESAT